MGALSLGWKLIGLSCMALVMAGLMGSLGLLFPRLQALRVVALGLVIAAVVILIVAVIVGPGPWCGPGDAYEVPGCA